MHENGHGFDKVGTASKFSNAFELIEPPYWKSWIHPYEIKYILLHYREGNMGKYSARGWQYWPDQREGQYRTQ